MSKRWPPPIAVFPGHEAPGSTWEPLAPAPLVSVSGELCSYKLLGQTLKHPGPRLRTLWFLPGQWKQLPEDAGGPLGPAPRKSDLASNHTWTLHHLLRAPASAGAKNETRTQLLKETEALARKPRPDVLASACDTTAGGRPHCPAAQALSTRTAAARCAWLPAGCLGPGGGTFSE